MKTSPIKDVTWLDGRRIRLQVSRDTVVTVVSFKALGRKARKSNVAAPAKAKDRRPAKRRRVR